MNWNVIQQAMPVFMAGFRLTLWLSLVGIIGSIIVGIIASLFQYFKVSVLSQISTAYVELARNNYFSCIMLFQFWV